VNKLRALILAGKFSIKDIFLSKGEIEVVRLAQIKPISSAGLSRAKGVTTQRACNILAKLKTKGYLESKEIHIPGNNAYQVYSVPKALRKLL
jgi:hypothetical protein